MSDIDWKEEHKKAKRTITYWRTYIWLTIEDLILSIVRSL